MSYVRENLMNGEEVLYEGRIHWFVYMPGVAVVLFSLALGSSVASPFFFLIGLFLLVNALIARRTTELAVTNRRVITKTGLIRRSTMELNHGKVESFNVDQSILGRLFDYGTVVINGTGAGRTPVRVVDQPMLFRRMAMEVIDNQQQTTGISAA